MTRKLKHMELGLFQRVIDEAKDWTEFVWLDHFGDPLLNPSLFDMIAYAKSKKLHIGFSTNATSLKSDNSRKLINLKLDLLNISLDGTDQETYQYYRGSNANYEKAVGFLEEHIRQKLELHSLFPYTVVSMIKMEKTALQVDAFKKLWSRDGIDWVLIKQFSAMSGTIDSINELRTVPKPSDATLPKCYFPWSSVTVLADGKVVPCCYDYDGQMILGDLAKDSLAAVWNGKKMNRLRRDHILGDYRKNILCRNCVDRRSVRGLGFISKRVRNAIKNKPDRGFDFADVGMWYA